jgi:orotidine 5'-phosphate decarboxylase subfamily 1
MTSRSQFAADRGILFAADIPQLEKLFVCLDAVCTNVDAIKLGNSVLYSGGCELVRKIKRRYGSRIVVDLKLTDVSHIASTVVEQFVESGADAIVVAGLCGPDVLRSSVKAAKANAEIWVFTEFTHDTGMIDEALADSIVRTALRSGVVGFQVPGTRPHRIEDVRAEIGKELTIAACGIGAQGGLFGSAIASGANLEIIGRGIYARPAPALAAAEARSMVQKCAASKRAVNG